jgi:hypothetical protein
MTTLTAPKRIQRKRTRGWRMPAGAVYVGRPSKWGNPFKVGEVVAHRHRSAAHPFDLYVDHHPVVHVEQAVVLFESVVADRGDHQLVGYEPPLVGEIRDALAGKDLVCWCPVDDQFCHADVLLRIANEAAT